MYEFLHCLDKEIYLDFLFDTYYVYENIRRHQQLLTVHCSLEIKFCPMIPPAGRPGG